MVVLVKALNGMEKAVDLHSGGWTATPMTGDETVVEMFLDSGESFIVSLEQYDKLVMDMVSNGDVIDLRNNENPEGPIPR